MTKYKQLGSDEGGITESNYARLTRTKEHSWCLWNDHGFACSKSAVFLTTVLASKTKQLPGGPHMSVLRGGYCSEHHAMFQQAVTRVSEDASRSGTVDWRDAMVDAASARS